MRLQDKVEITMFPAGAGDCLLIEFLEEDYRILIDGGYAETYQKYLKKHLMELASEEKRIDLLVITHIDADHIGGILAFLRENGSALEPSIIEVKEVWYNAFFHMYNQEVGKSEISYTTREVLKGKVASNKTNLCEGKQDISVAQGNTVSSLLIKGNYNWNSTWLSRAICVENGENRKLTSKIQCTLLGPDEKSLSVLSDFWISKMKRKIRRFNICDDILYSEAFECDCMYVEETLEEVRREDISYKLVEDATNIDLEKWANTWSGQIDASSTNRSSISFLLEYEGRKMLFPGDAPLQIFKDKLPKKIDLVKLPHHGSEKNIDKDFIQNIEVYCYLLSTDGKKHGHPSKSVIGSIFCNTSNTPRLFKNYDLLSLKSIGEVAKDEYEW